jgi:hypothetical protein
MEDMVLEIPREETFLSLARISGLNRLVCPLRQALSSRKVSEVKFFVEVGEADRCGDRGSVESGLRHVGFLACQVRSGKWSNR